MAIVGHWCIIKLWNKKMAPKVTLWICFDDVILTYFEIFLKVNEFSIKLIRFFYELALYLVFEMGQKMTPLVLLVLITRLVSDTILKKVRGQERTVINFFCLLVNVSSYLFFSWAKILYLTMFSYLELLDYPWTDRTATCRPTDFYSWHGSPCTT